MLKCPARSRASLQGLTLLSHAKGRGNQGVLWQRGLPWVYRGGFRGSRASFVLCNDPVSPDAISFSSSVTTPTLRCARSTPETLRLPPGPAASLPSCRGLLPWPTLAPKMRRTVQQTSEYPLSRGFPEEMVSQHDCAVRKFNNIQLKFSFINMIPLLLAACTISLLSPQCLCTQAICRMLSSLPLAAACLK